MYIGIKLLLFKGFTVCQLCKALMVVVMFSSSGLHSSQSSKTSDQYVTKNNIQ